MNFDTVQDSELKNLENNQVDICYNTYKIPKV